MKDKFLEPKKKRMLKKSFRLPVDIWDVIKELSEDHNTTTSIVVRMILNEFINDYKLRQYEGI